MWIVVVNGMAFLIYGLASGRWRRMLLPIRPREIIATLADAMRFKLSHDDLTVYNAVQKLLYVGIILVAVVEVTAGLAIWKPVQLSHLAALFWSFQGARLVHFFGMIAIVAFLCVHVLLALLVPRTLLAMITGGPKVDIGRGAPPVVLAPQPGE
jgi:thiosulfate reductase cytochrome b subunit